MHYDPKIILAELRLHSSLPKSMTPAREDPTTHGQQDRSATALQPDSPCSPLSTHLLPQDMVNTIEPIQEVIHPLVPMMERGVVVRVEVIGRQRVKAPREARMSTRLGW